MKELNNRVEIVQWLEINQEKRKGRFFKFLPVKWWRTVSTKNIGTELHITTEQVIENVYLNGEKII